MKTRTAEEEIQKLRADNERLNNAWHMLDWAVRATIAAGHLDEAKFQTAMEMSKTLGRPAQIVDPEAFSAADTVGPGDVLSTAKMTQGLTVVVPSIAPCPFCGSSDVAAESCDEAGGHFVYCSVCQAEGPLEKSADEAIAFWNKRQASSEVEALRAEPARIKAALLALQAEATGHNYYQHAVYRIFGEQAAQNPPQDASPLSVETQVTCIGALTMSGHLETHPWRVKCAVWGASGKSLHECRFTDEPTPNDVAGAISYARMAHETVIAGGSPPPRYINIKQTIE